MPEFVELLLAAAAGAVGMGWLALAKLTHWRQVTGQESQAEGTRRSLRLLGAAGIGVSLVFCLLADHVSMSFLVWVMIQAVAALAVAMTLAFRPRLLSVLAPRRP